MRKRIDATIYLGDTGRYHTYIWVDESATDQEIISAINTEALSLIEVEWQDSGIRTE